jgi:hypothetical protein
MSAVSPFPKPTLLHNPKCTKRRAAKALLDERQVAYEERRYLERSLSAAELAELRRRLDRPAREWVRTGEDAFKAAGLAKGRKRKRNPRGHGQASDLDRAPDPDRGKQSCGGSPHGEHRGPAGRDRLSTGVTERPALHADCVLPRRGGEGRFWVCLECAG